MLTKQKQRIHFSWYKESLLIIMWFIIKNTTKHKNSNNCDVDMESQLLSLLLFSVFFSVAIIFFLFDFRGVIFLTLLFVVFCLVSVRFRRPIKGKIAHLTQYLPQNCSAQYFLYTTGSHIFISLLLILNFTYSHIFNRNESGLCLYKATS